MRPKTDENNEHNFVADDLVDDALMEKTPTMEGRFLNMIVTPAPVSAKKPSLAKEPQGAEA